MDFILLALISVGTFLLLLVAPKKIRNVIAIMLVVSVEYIRNIISNYGFFSTSQANYLSISIYASIIVFYIFVYKNTVKKFFIPSFRLIPAFWLVYVLSGIFSVPLFGVELKSVILVGLKVLSVLCIAVNLKHLNDIYVCILITVVLGAADFLLGLTGRLTYNVLRGSRDLGFIPWLREDTIWFAPALLWANVAFFSIKGRKPINQYIELIFKLAIGLFLIAIIVYGNITVQIRSFTIEVLIGMLVILSVSNIKRGFKIFLLAILLVGTGMLIWQSFDPNSKLSAVSGLLQRNDGGRLELWSYSTQVWMRSPIIGHGIGTDGIMISEFMLPGRQTSHNVYFTLGIELGIVGLIVWLFINFKTIWLEVTIIKNRKGNPERKKVLVVLILHITMLFHLAFHGLVYFPWVIMLPTLSYMLRKSFIDNYVKVGYIPPIPRLARNSTFTG